MYPYPPDCIQIDPVPWNNPTHLEALLTFEDFGGCILLEKTSGMDADEIEKFISAWEKRANRNRIHFSDHWKLRNTAR